MRREVREAIWYGTEGIHDGFAGHRSVERLAMYANPDSIRFATVATFGLLLIGIVVCLAPTSPVSGQDQPLRVALRELDTVGELRTETSRRDLTLEFVLPDRTRTVIDRSDRELDMLTMSVDADRKATGIRLTINRLRREHLDNGQKQQTIDAAEGTSVALVDRGAVAEWRGPNGFPLPAHAVTTGDTWTVDGQQGLANFSDNGIYDQATATFTVTAINRQGDQLVAELRRVLDRSGQSGGSTVREHDEGTMSFDVTKGRPISVRTTSAVEVVQGGLRGTGTRTTRISWTYRQMPLYRILPRAQEGVTQREHAESVTELVIGASNPRTGAQAVIHRHVESLGVIHRHIKKVDANGRPQEMTLDVLTAWQHTVVGSTKPGEQPRRTTAVGPLHALQGIKLARTPDTDGEVSRMQVADDSLAAGVRTRQADPVNAPLFRESLPDQVAAALDALTSSLQPLAVPGVPIDPVPVGYTWSLPDELALKAFAGLLEGVTIRRVSAEAQFVDVRQWGGRPRVATLATRLDLHGQSADGLILEASMPSVTYFDLDEGRPLAMTGTGRIAMRLQTPERRVEGRGSVRAHTRYYYDRGPGTEVPDDDARRRVAGEWTYTDPGNAASTQTLRLQLDGTLAFTHPDLRGQPVTESGHWRLLPPASAQDQRLRLLITIGARNRDVYALRISAQRLEFERVDDTRHRTGIVPLLLGRTATWRR